MDVAEILGLNTSEGPITEFMLCLIDSGNGTSLCHLTIE